MILDVGLAQASAISQNLLELLSAVWGQVLVKRSFKLHLNKIKKPVRRKQPSFCILAVDYMLSYKFNLNIT